LFHWSDTGALAIEEPQGLEIPFDVDCDDCNLVRSWGFEALQRFYVKLGWQRDALAYP
jgi:hypothetical protein